MTIKQLIEYKLYIINESNKIISWGNQTMNDNINNLDQNNEYKDILCGEDFVLLVSLDKKLSILYNNDNQSSFFFA